MSPCFLAQWCKAMNGGQLIFKMLLKDNKKDDFRRMFCEYYPKQVRFAVQLTGNADEGRDVVADVMEKAWERFDLLRPADRGSWLYMCVRNTCINRLKHIKTENCAAAELAEVTKADAESEYRDHERLLSRVEAVAEGLGEPARSIVRLCYYEHLTRRQAAERLGISYDTVKKHIAKALKLLREAVGKETNYER